MNRRLPSYILLCLFAAWSLSALVSCQRGSDLLQEERKGTLQPVNLALCMGSLAGSTKVDAFYFTEVNLSDPVFRGMTDVKVIPFYSDGAVQSDDPAAVFPVSLPGITSLYTLENPYYYSYYYSTALYTSLPSGTSAVLLYGHAPGSGTDVASKQQYGSLIPDGFDVGDSAVKASSLVFRPDVMFPEGDVPDEAHTIVDFLNHVMQDNTCFMTAVYGDDDEETSVSVTWNDNIGDTNLRALYQQITNDGAFIPGSGPLVESLLSGLYAVFSNFESVNSNVYEVVVDGVPYEARKIGGEPLYYKDLYNGLKDVVLQKFSGITVAEIVEVDADNLTVTFRNETVRNYPESLGLPSGCAILRWTPAGFVIPEMNGVEGLAPMNRYCYPPSLYYYTNTSIRTSDDLEIAKSYTDKGYTEWTQILADYTLGTAVTANAKSVALVKPVQFAVGLLSATVKAGRTMLPDNDGLAETAVEASGENLPLTGVVLGGQYAQAFDFTPIVTEDGEYYVYDKNVPGVFLTDEQSTAFRTLSLQTPEDEDVYFALEFRNDTGKTFYGADGRILPGRKFYMLGKLTLPEKTTEHPREFDNVFLQDHVTTVDCTIQSLEGAYNAVPDLGLPQLILGVQTKVNWTLSSPTTVMLE